MDELEKLKKIIQEHENRISNLEKQFLKKKPNPVKQEKSKYSGTSGGILLLIENGFLDNPKTANEIYEEMKREGYYNPKKNVDGTLRIVFVKNKTLQRIKDDKVWKYVTRKWLSKNIIKFKGFILLK